MLTKEANDKQILKLYLSSLTVSVVEVRHACQPPDPKSVKVQLRWCLLAGGVDSVWA